MRKEELIKQVAESRGFGTLSPKHYKRKVARNIHKNETIVIAEHYTPHFKPAKSFKNKTKNL